MPATLEKLEDRLAVSLTGLPRGEFQEAKAKIKDIPGKRWDPDAKLWYLPPEPRIAQRVLSSIGPDTSDEVLEWVREAQMQAEVELATQLPDDVGNLLVPWGYKRIHWQPEYIEVAGYQEPFNGLMKHQRPVVDLAARERKVIIADDMGLGKTGIAITAVAERYLRLSCSASAADLAIESGPKLIVAENSAKETWRRELTIWQPPGTPWQLIDGSSLKTRRKQLEQAIADNAWCWVNWEQIRARKERRKTRAGTYRRVEVMKEPLFESTKWQAVIVDEIHRAKNRNSQQRRGLRRCRADDGLMLGLTGTAIQNSPADLWPILEWLWPEQYTSFWAFYDDYVEWYEVKGRYGGRVVTGVKNPDMLRFELKNRLVRRTQDILDLPGKRRVGVPVELTPQQRKLYKEAEEQMWVEIERDLEAARETGLRGEDALRLQEVLEQGKASSLLKLPHGAARTLRLRQIIETPATLGAEDSSGVLDTCVDRIMDSRPEQWVVFCAFKPTVYALVERLRTKGLAAEPYTGDQDSDTERPRLERDFQAGQIDVLVGTIRAMYQSITLTAGSKQFWVSRDWVPAINEQGEDRQHRIGQRRKVTIFIAQPQNTVATGKVEPTNRRKERIVRAVLPKIEIEEE